MILSRVFADEIAEGELDFLDRRCVRIQVSDVGLGFSVTRRDGRILVDPADQQVDLSISGSVYDYLLMISGREDPDTLFFQRHLLMEGDTGLGVHLKNFLAAVDVESLPLPGGLQLMMKRCLNLYERMA